MTCAKSLQEALDWKFPTNWRSRGRYKAHDCKRNPAISINLSLFYTVSKFIIILDKKTNKKLVLKYFENDLKTIFIFLQKEIDYWMSPKFFNERHII